MPIDITIRSHPRRTKVKLDQSLMWYDQKTKQMIQGRGGRIDFGPDGTPKIVDEYTYRQESDWPKIRRFLSGVPGAEVLDLRAPHSVEIRIPDASWDRMEAELSRAGFDYDWERIKEEKPKQRSPDRHNVWNEPGETWRTNIDRLGEFQGGQKTMWKGTK